MFFPKPRDFVFAVTETPDGPVALLCSKQHWQEHKTMEDEHLGIEEILPDYMQEEVMEGTFAIHDSKSIADAHADLVRRGFTLDPSFVEFIRSRSSTPTG